MSKFKIKLKLQGLELEVEGSREDLPHLSKNLSDQITGLIQPAVALVSGEEAPETIPQSGLVIEGTATDTTRKKRKKTTRTNNNPSSAAVTEGSAIDWVHDPQKWGSPSQTWKAWEKAIWLIYVVSKETETTQLSHVQIVATFNKHFKQAKTIAPFNVARDLGRKKSGKEALVGENTVKSPSEWFLTDEGRKYAEKLAAGKQNKE